MAKEKVRSYKLVDLSAAVAVPLAMLQGLADGASSCYHRSSVPKRGGGLRTIDAPEPALKDVQRLLLHRVLAALPTLRTADSLFARSASQNARSHRAYRYTTSLDISSAFPSVKRDVVFAALRREGFTKDAAALVCKLCTLRGCLPQGAPTSPALMSLVLAPLDAKIAVAFPGRGIHYTRYADNITVSGPDDLRSVECAVEAQLRQLGLSLNQGKTERGGFHVPVLVTGVLVGRAARVPPAREVEYRDRIREIAADEQPTRVEVARGILSWVRSVNPRQAARLYAETVPATSPLKKALKRKRRHPR